MMSRVGLSNEAILYLGTREIVAYHKAKRKCINLKDIESIDPDLIQIYEFNGQDFDLLA